MHDLSQMRLSKCLKDGVKFYFDSPEFSIYAEEKNLQHSHEILDINQERNEIDDRYFNERK